jgi:cytochrome c peroxidase
VFQGWLPRLVQCRARLPTVLFDNGRGDQVPAPDETGFRNEPIRQAVLLRFNDSGAYRSRFGKLFPEVRDGEPITFLHVARAIAEFEFTMTFANAPVDSFARGERGAMTAEQKRGAILFFGKAGCVSCHSVAGSSNEMFSDFKNHVLGVPQIAPVFDPRARPEHLCELVPEKVPSGRPVLEFQICRRMHQHD